MGFKKNDQIVKRSDLKKIPVTGPREDGEDTGKEVSRENTPASEELRSALGREEKNKDLIRRFGQWLLTLMLLWPVSGWSQPMADFTARSVQGCSPFRAEFVNLSAGAVRCQWYFGNGNTSNLRDPQAIYNVPGVYTVKLVVYDSLGRADSQERHAYIRVFRNPEAMFNLSSATSCSGDTLRVYDQSKRGDAGLAHWQWDMGDGTTTAGQRPLHVYRSQGAYAVGLAVTDSNGCRSSHKVSDAVRIYGSPSVDIHATGNRRCKAPVQVSFRAVCTGRAPFQVLWGFGDGTTGSGTAPNHQYLQNGTFPVWCVVTDANGCKVRRETADLVSIQEPRIGMGVASSNICTGGEARFEAVPEPNDGTGSYIWRFEDGDSAKSPVVRKSFLSPGEFGASLRYSWDGCIATTTRSGILRVSSGPEGRIVPDDTIVCRSRGAKMAFSVAGSGFDSLYWLSDTGRLSMPQFNRRLLYPMDTANGLYQIRARIVSVAGCGEKVLTTTYRLRGPIPELTYTNRQGCLPVNSKIEYTGTGDAPIVSYHWTIPALGATSSTREISVTNNRFGISPLLLTVRDKNGCAATISGMIMAGKRFGLDFEVPRKTFCVGEPFKIFNKSPYKGSDSVTFHYSWFNNDTIFCGNKDSFFGVIRDLPGKNYRLSFTVNSFGCTNRITPDRGPEVTLLGPLARGTADPYCEEDSIRGWNTSLDFTSTTWKYRDENGKWIYQPDLRLLTVLGDKASVSIVAENSINKCKDSIELPLNVDPQVASFDHAYNCRNGQLSAVSTYESKYPESAYRWELLNLKDSARRFFTGRRIKAVVSASGRYALSLRISNSKFACTRPQRVFFGFPDSTMRAAFSVETDRSSCFPVNLTLRDPWFRNWTGARWKIGDSLVIPDTSAVIRCTFQQQEGRIPVYLQRFDPIGCDVSDTVYVDVRQLRGRIAVDQDYSNCKQTRATFTALADRSSAADSLQFFWDFGHRTSQLQRDTVHQRPGSMHIKLAVIDKTGCYSRDSMNITLHEARPRAAFYTPDSLNLCPPLAVRFFDSSSTKVGNIVSWQWNFGDGAGSQLRHPSKLYLTPGKYPVSLVVLASTGCRDTLNIPDLVWVKGPIGDLKFTQLSGCQPMRTAFSTKTQGQLARVDVDMGDGRVLHNRNAGYTYLKPGKYVPRMILTDSAGCRYSPRARDTITVFAKPEAQLQGRNLCRGEVLHLRPGISSPDPIGKITWQVDGAKQTEKDSITLMSDVSRIIRVRVQVATSHTCADTAEASYRVFGIDPFLSSPKAEVCLGEKLVLREETTSDTAIVSRQLWIGSKAVVTGNPAIYIPSERGILPMRYVLKDALGCSAEISDPVFLRSGDTLSPPAQHIYYSSVTGDFSTETRFSASTEPDFRRQVLYIWLNGQWTGADSSEDRNDTLMNVHSLNTLRQSYCHRVIQQNFCGRLTEPVRLVSHCTVEAGSRADTNAAKVHWSPYTGWKDVGSYRIWRRDRNSRDPFALIDSVDGNTNRYTDLSVYCHRTYDYRIQALEAGGFRQLSMSDTTTCSPIHHLPVPMPEIWRATVEDNKHVLTEFGLFAKHKYPIAEYELLRADGEIFRVNAGRSACISGFEDFDTRVQDEFYTYRIRATDVCGTVSVPSNPGRSILLRVHDDSAFKAVLSWNTYSRWNEGVERYLVERRFAGSAFTPIGYTDTGVTSYIDGDIPRTCASGVEYRITAVRRQPEAPDSSYHVVSQSNHAGFVPEIRFFTPNAFTPDGNRLNEAFHPKGVFFSEYELAVYNRWGEKLFQDTGCEPAWDGNYMGQPAPEGVYAWRITARDYAGRNFEFSGIVHLLR